MKRLISSILAVVSVVALPLGGFAEAGGVLQPVNGQKIQAPGQTAPEATAEQAAPAPEGSPCAGLATVPVLTVPLGEYLIMPEELAALHALEATGEQTMERAGTPPEVEHLLALLAQPPSTDNAWNSGNPQVAVINENGILSAIGVGETLITKTHADGGATQILVQVTELEQFEVYRPYDRVLPPGALD